MLADEHATVLANSDHIDPLSAAAPAAVIFGKGEKGNLTRIARTLKKGLFVYPGRKDTIKACVYVKDVCRLIAERCPALP